jgi:N-acetylglucosaminyl-diphospho-decaprenol L-rhamnosyltransferase
VHQRLPSSAETATRGDACPATISTAAPVRASRAPDVSVVIVSYNTCDLLLACIASLRHDPAIAEIIVVDNASHDGTPGALRATHADVRLIASPENRGFAWAANRGAEAAGHRYLLLLNPDAVARAPVAAILRDAADAHPTFGVFGGKMLDADGRMSRTSCFELPSLWSYITFATGLSTALSNSPRANPEALPGWDGSNPRPVGFVSGGLLLVSLQLWRELGGLDETYFLYGEDADFGLRCHQAGVRAMAVPEAVVVHVGGASSASSTAQLCRVMQGRAHYLHRNWSGNRRRAGIALLQAGVGLRALLAQASGRHDAPWIGGWADRRRWRRGFAEEGHVPVPPRRRRTP